MPAAATTVYEYAAFDAYGIIDGTLSMTEEGVEDEVCNLVNEGREIGNWVPGRRPLVEWELY
jgi:hypothetical protein